LKDHCHSIKEINKNIYKELGIWGIVKKLII